MFDQRVGGHYDLPCLMSNSLRGSLEMTGTGLEYTASTVGVSCTTRVKRMMNNRAMMVSLKFWVVDYEQSNWFSVICKDCSGINGIFVNETFAECFKVLHTCCKWHTIQLTPNDKTLCPLDPFQSGFSVHALPAFFINTSTPPAQVTAGIASRMHSGTYCNFPDVEWGRR